MNFFARMMLLEQPFMVAVTCAGSRLAGDAFLLKTDRPQAGSYERYMEWIPAVLPIMAMPCAPGAFPKRIVPTC